MKKAIQRINETKNQFFEKINKTDKPLSKLIERQGKNMQINTIRNEKEDIITDIEFIESSGHTSKTCTPQNWKI